jgi:hypothetical protein
VEDGREIDLERAPPLRLAHLGERHLVGRPDAGVGDEEVEPAEALAARVEERCRAGLGLDCGGVREGVRAGRAQFRDGRFRVGVARVVADRDVRAGRREQPRRRAPDAARAAGDERALAGEAGEDQTSGDGSAKCEA